MKASRGMFRMADSEPSKGEQYLEQASPAVLLPKIHRRLPRNHWVTVHSQTIRANLDNCADEGHASDLQSIGTCRYWSAQCSPASTVVHWSLWAIYTQTRGSTVRVFYWGQWQFHRAVRRFIGFLESDRYIYHSWCHYHPQLLRFYTYVKTSCMLPRPLTNFWC